jgi:branched-chain amino acid transport system substrate-binding protein
VALTGKYAESGKYYEEAYRLWESQVNEKGGLLGRPVELIIYDDTSDPDTGLSLYEKLITVDKVDLLLGPYTSGIVEPTSALAEKYGMLFLEGGGDSAQLFERGFKYLFLTLPGLAQGNPKVPLSFVESLPEAERPKSMALIYLDDLPMIAESEGAKEKAQEIGLPIVYEEKIPKGVTDLIPTISKARESGAELLIGDLFLPEGVLATRAMKEMDYSPKLAWFSVGPAMSDWRDSLGDDGEYIWGTTTFSTKAKTPGLEEFVTAYQGMWNRLPDYHAAGGYAAAQILQAAIEATQSVDNDVLRDHLVANEFPTVIGTLSWDEKGRPKPAKLGIQWINGEMEILWPPESATTDPVYPMPTWSER